MVILCVWTAASLLPCEWAFVLMVGPRWVQGCWARRVALVAGLPVSGCLGELVGATGRSVGVTCGRLVFGVDVGWVHRVVFLGARVLELVGTGVIGARILLGVFVCAALLSFGLSGRFLFVLCWFWCGAALCWASGFGRCVIWALGARRRAGVGRCSWALCRWGAWECWAWCVPVSPVS